MDMESESSSGVALIIYIAIRRVRLRIRKAINFFLVRVQYIRTGGTSEFYTSFLGSSLLDPSYLPLLVTF